ncbi:ABC transporter substrate-binding protein [Puniceicoccaceae bacterium]|nr:ABC transporter substrate-binding protein [Puniceicoccaceae bacterium]
MGNEERDKLENAITKALNVLYGDRCTDLSLEEKQAKVRESLEADYDLDVLIRRIIGRNWRILSETEQKQVLELVKQLVVKAFVNGLAGEIRPEVEMGKAILIADNRLEVESTVALNESTFYVTYRLGRMSSGWQIYDIVAENISVVSNYRQQIDDHFRKRTSAELITRLESMLKNNDLNGNTEI